MTDFLSIMIDARLKTVSVGSSLVTSHTRTYNTSDINAGEDT